MPKMKILGSREVIKFLVVQGFLVNRQNGSHIILVRHRSLHKQVLTVPERKEIQKGTLKGIYNQASKFISRDDLDNFFYTI